MTPRVDELLAEIRAALPPVTTPFTRADRADRVYEGYLFAQVIAAAAECGAEVVFKDRDGDEVRDLVFRGAPGSLYTWSRFTYAVLYLGQARPVEVHLRVKVQGRVLACESDVLLIDMQAASDSRDKKKLPKPSGCVLTVEGKHYLGPLPRDEVMQYRGVRSEFPSTMTSLFVANSFSVPANQCLSGLKQPYELGVMPRTRFQQHLRSQIREALRRHVIKFDFSHRM
ncbi:hypothetical protein QLQ12_40180 [Actinoplanes sp. NEAU-A12]|uniref:Transposase n=1 Tax=Actinoplanes sandaracinus TaxID=3045177 RepID=A0ABT6WYZ5_9ACTN|nr:hypothetical protein [Actinoplanes sandaracinus]MDI6104825.1 hypothetical protein [Actinoplanes sandaracinus]